MRWLVFVLVALNALVWFAGDLWVPDRVQVVAAARTLPRVATLKVGVTAPDEGVEGRAPAETDEAPSGNGAAQTPEAATGEPMCVRLGWFETGDSARERYGAIGRPGERMRVVEQERALKPLHWVIIPPQPEDQALSLYNELQSRGEDSYLVSRGENTNAISLGLFESKAAALRVLEAKKSQNLNAVLANFPRNQISYALVFEVPRAADAEDGEGWFEDYRDDFEMVEISRCSGIATSPENP